MNAVSDRNRGAKVKTGKALLRTVFPARINLEGRYPWLKKCPFLLPAAWADRILKYRKETRTIERNSSQNSIRIGNRRIELMRQYGILDDEM